MSRYWIVLVTLLLGLSVVGSGFAGDSESASRDRITAGKLGLDIDSAIDLVGPEGTIASENRRALADRLEDHLTRRFKEEPLLVELHDLVDFLGFGHAARVGFDDGSRIRVKLHWPGGGESDRGRQLADRLGVEVEQTTAQGEGLPAVPQSPGQFERFAYSGSARMINSLGQLADRLGVHLQFGDQSSGCEGDIACEAVEGAPQCRMSFSQALLEDCVN